MLKTSSPYIKYLYSTKVKWFSYDISSLNKSVREDKMIFIHFGQLLNIEERESAFTLFNNDKIAEILNTYFIPIAIDAEDIPEATIIGFDLLLMSEHKVINSLNILMLPNAKPFTSISSLSIEEMFFLLKNSISAFKTKRNILEKAANYLTIRLKNSGIITEKKPLIDIKPKILHAYIRHWGVRYFYNIDKRSNQYSIKPRFLVFILKYAIRFKDTELLEKTKNHMLDFICSPIFDLVDGGVFTHCQDKEYKKPMFEKNLSENSQCAVLFSQLYKEFKIEAFNYAANKTISFIESKLKSPHGGYYHGITLNLKDNSYSNYYQYSIKQIKKAFPNKWDIIILGLGMDPLLDENDLQYIHLTQYSINLSKEDICILKKIRHKYSKELWYDKRRITAYNCLHAIDLMIAAKHLRSNKGDYINLAKDIIEIILSKNTKKGLKLYRYVNVKGEEYSHADLHDYSMLLNALIHLYKLTKEEKYKYLITQYTSYIFLNFYQSNNGMFSETSKHENITPYKRESIIDYTRYSGNSIMARNLLILNRITNDTFYLDIFKQQISNIENEFIGSGPFMVGWALQILNYLTDDSQKGVNCPHNLKT